MMTIHPLAAILRQQGRMDVHHLEMIVRNQIVWHHHKESCKHHKSDTIGIQHLQGAILICEIRLGQRERRHTKTLCPLKSKSISPVAHHKSHPRHLTIREMSDDVLAVTTVARDEYRNIYHILYI